MLLKGGRLDSLDRPVLDFFADSDIANLDARKKAITVQNLLDITSGFEWDEGFEGGKEQSLTDLGRSSDWIKFVLDRPMAHAPGETFYYNSGNSYLLSAIITKLTGQRAEDFARDRLFGPLGIERPYWREAPRGLSMGAGGLELKPRDMAKFGYLYLRHGEWAGQQLLPPQFVEALGRGHVDMHASYDPNLRYANQFWVMPDRHVFMAWGYHCQAIIVFPAHDIVTVVTAHDNCPSKRLAGDISDAVKSEAVLPPDPAAAAQLAKALSDAATGE
jgi:CubicO group peptidase (beta-lactamase class C family)